MVYIVLPSFWVILEMLHADVLLRLQSNLSTMATLGQKKVAIV